MGFGRIKYRETSGFWETLFIPFLGLLCCRVCLFVASLQMLIYHVHSREEHTAPHHVLKLTNHSSVLWSRDRSTANQKPVFLTRGKVHSLSRYQEAKGKTNGAAHTYPGGPVMNHINMRGLHKVINYAPHFSTFIILKTSSSRGSKRKGQYVVVV